jgi:surfeit locus 1 family protein
VLRTALTPRWLGWLAVVVALAVGMVWLGIWQYRVAEANGVADALREANERPVIALTAYLQPHTAFPADGSNQRLTAVGHYEPARRVWVLDRRLAGVEGYWVLEPFVVEATGARIPVVRGFVTSHPAALPPSAGSATSTGPGPSATLTLVGSLAPTEGPGTPRRPPQAGEVAAVSVGALLNDWGGEVYNAFLFAISETPDPGDVGPAGSSAAGATGAMERVPPPLTTGGLTLRNAAYALQWWAFAVFVGWMWVKMVREDYRRAVAREGDSAPTAPTTAPTAGAPL